MTDPVIVIAPSILSADLGHLAEEVEKITQGGADWIHVDIMDGHFVPNLTFGTMMVRTLRRITDLPLDVHLMVEHPEAYFEGLSDAGTNVVTFHPEATVHVHRHLETARNLGMKAGLALNPGTPTAFAEEVLDDLDLILLMSVDPGFAGQGYIPSVTGKIQRIRDLVSERSAGGVRIEVDGGISRKTIEQAFHAGADTFVAGSAIFGAPDPATEVRELRKLCTVRV